MDDLERIERLLLRMQARHRRQIGNEQVERTLREVQTYDDVTEALDDLERHKAECDPPGLRCASCGLTWAA